jgi:hypothetical protein
MVSCPFSRRTNTIPDKLRSCRLIEKILSGYHSFSRFRIRVIAWFVRLAWLPTLLWGCADLITLWTQPLSSMQADKLEDAAIRLSFGCVLFLIWLFMIRTRGRWTLNADGKLEQ